MVSYRNYRISDLEVRPSIVFAPDAFLALDYSGAPTQFQLEREIENNLHTNQDLQVGCPVCGNVDLFTREINTKGRRFRCGYCFYNSDSEFESVKSQKDITLSKFGLLYECQICGEAIDSYNRGTVLRHIKKHQDEAKVLEAETQNKITHGVAVLQPDNSKVTGVVYFADAGSGVAISYRIKGLSDGEHGFHIHEYGDLTDGCTSACAHFNPDNEVHGGLETPVRHFGDLGNIESQKSISEGEIYLPKAKLDSSKYGILGRMMIVHADRDDLGKGGDAESLKTGNAGKRLACGVIGLAEPPTHKKAESKMNLELDQQDPNDPNRMWGPDVISPIYPLKGYERPVEEVRAQLKKSLVGFEIRMYGPQTPEEAYSMKQSLDWWKTVGFSEPQPVGTYGKVTGVSDSNPNMPWVIGVWVTITQGGSPKHPVGSRVWFHVKDSDFPGSMSRGWEQGDYMAEGIRECCECSTTEGLTTIQAGTFCWDCLPINLGAEEIVCPNCDWSWQRSEGGDDLFTCHKCGFDNETYHAEDNYDAKNQEYVDDLLSKYPNIPVVHAKTIHDITDTDTIYRIDFPLTMYRATSSDYGTEKIGEIGYLQGTNKNYGMYFDKHFNDGEHMKEIDFATVPVRKVYGALTMGAPIRQYLPKDAGELLAIDLEGYYIISVRGDFWSRYFNKIDEHAVPAVLGDVQAEDVLMLFEPTMMSAEDNYDSTYGVKQAKIRRKLKNKIKKQAIMGTKAGQWSARKSQELKRQYEAACSKKGLKPYKGQKTKSQDNLSKWSKQGWKTASGKKSSVTGEPYFPAKAVTALKQKNLYAKAKRQKQAATKAGKQNARYSDDIRAVVRQYRSEETLITTSEIKSLLRDLKDTEVDWEDVDWETDEPPIDESWLDEVEWDSEECAVCRITIEAGDGDLCEVCWESYEQSLQPTKVTTEWWAEDSTSPNQWQILNWIVKSPVPVPNKEPLRCLECKSANIEGRGNWENEGDSFAYRDVVCNNCECIWREVWHYQESEIREHGDQYHLPVSKRFSAPYQPNQTLLDYSPYEMATSSVITGDFFTDSLKYGFGPESKSSENVR